MARHARPRPLVYRISNESWAYATATEMWDGEEVYTAQEHYESQSWNEMCADMAAAERFYGDCGRSIVGTGDYEQMLAEDARAAYGLPAYPYSYL